MAAIFLISSGLVGCIPSPQHLFFSLVPPGSQSQSSVIIYPTGGLQVYSRRRKAYSICQKGITRDGIVPCEGQGKVNPEKDLKGGGEEKGKGL